MTDRPMDPSVLADLTEAVGAEFAAELVQTFVDEAPGMLADLAAAANSGDADGFRRAAHSIKSNAETFGALALANLARKLELDGVPADAPGAIAALDAEFQASASALKGALDG